MNLRELAQYSGVLTEYIDYEGRLHSVGDDTIVAVLAAVGVDVVRRSFASARDEYDTRRRDQRAVIVAWDGEVDEAAAVTYDLPRSMAFGYHPTPTAFVIAAPKRAAPLIGRHHGVYAPTYALHHAARRDVGDLAGLRTLVDWVVGHEGDAVLTLPLLATFPDVASPYSPISRLHWNELHIAFDELPELRAWSDRENFGFLSTPPDRLIDYPRAFAAAQQALDVAVGGLSDRRRGQLGAFLRHEPDVAEYARFRATGERHGRDWHRWPESAAASGDPHGEAALRHCYAQWVMRQQLAGLAQHARSRGALLGLDLPLGTHPDGYDAYIYRPLFAPGVSTGAPPDAFFPLGQNWGFAPPLPAEDSGYSYFINSVRNHLRYSSFLRIDHVMQFRRLYWIPDGAAPTEGTYVTYPFEHYLAIMCLESHLAGVPIVGENLGVVPAEIDAALETHGILGTSVFYAFVDGARFRNSTATPVKSVPTWSVAAINTHDMPTTQGFVDGADLEDRYQLGALDAAGLAAARRTRKDDLDAASRELGVAGDASSRTIRDAALQNIAASATPLALVNLEDLWLEPLQQNVPGTTSERPNWRRLLRHAVDELEQPDISESFGLLHRRPR